MTRPNIIHILVDDLGYGDFSFFNKGISETPFLDQFIQESTSLSQHYTSSPVCNPSRASLLTGRYPHRTGSIDTLEWRGLERLDLNEVTIADILQDAGYRTGLIGKWHLGAFDPRYKPEKRGFDEAICFRGGMHDYYDWRLESGDRVQRADGRYLTDFWTDEAIDFLKRSPKDPFYLHLTYNAPHTPLQAPEEDLAVFSDRDDLSEAVKTLYAMIRRLDRNVGRLLESVDKLGLRENTLIVFSSDNGPQFGGAGDDCLDRFNCQLHGSKGSTYEGGIRVPAIVRWPAGLQKNDSGDNTFFHMCDWLPTILKPSQASKPPAHLKLDGVDQSAVLRGDSRPLPSKTLLAVEPLRSPDRIQCRDSRRRLETSAPVCARSLRSARHQMARRLDVSTRALYRERHHYRSRARGEFASTAPRRTLQLEKRPAGTNQSSHTKPATRAKYGARPTRLVRRRLC